MAQSQPERGDEHPSGRGSKPQLSLASAPPEATQDAVWFTACAWCRRINVRGHWRQAPAAVDVVGLQDGAREPLLTGGICPTCFQEVSGRAAEQRRLHDA
jgi:hypothetical protein